MNLFPVSILGTGSYVPEETITNAQLEKIVETSDEWIISRTGIKERRFASPTQSTSDLAYESGKRALESSGIQPSQIDMVILATISPDYSFPATSSIVATRLGCPQVASFDLEIACSGFVYAMAVASQFIQTGMYQYVLVIGAEINSRLLNMQDRNTCILFGDGAGALVMGRGEPGYGLKSQYLKSDGGELHKAIIRETGGIKEPISLENFHEGRHLIKMDGKATFKFAIHAFEDAMDKALKLAGMKADQIDFMIPHQANTRILESAAKRLDLPMEKVMINLDKYGNTVAASIGIALDEAVKDGKIKRGDMILFVAFGAGLSWASAIYKWQL